MSAVAGTFACSVPKCAISAQAVAYLTDEGRHVEILPAHSKRQGSGLPYSSVIINRERPASGPYISSTDGFLFNPYDRIFQFGCITPQFRRHIVECADV